MAVDLVLNFDKVDKVRYKGYFDILFIYLQIFHGKPVFT